MFIFSAIASVTRFTTNSCVSRMFRALSFGRLSRSPMETAKIIGRLETPMLKEKGAQLSTPERLRVETKAIGLGTNAEIMRPYDSLSGRDDGSTCTAIPLLRKARYRITIPPWVRFV